jgi:hypothetical protein
MRRTLDSNQIAIVEAVYICIIKKSLPKDLENALEPMLEAVFQSKQISKGTYLNQMGHQIDTVIRKNYTMITE